VFQLADHTELLYHIGHTCQIQSFWFVCDVRVTVFFVCKIREWKILWDQVQNTVPSVSHTLAWGERDPGSIPGQDARHFLLKPKQTTLNDMRNNGIIWRTILSFCYSTWLEVCGLFQWWCLIDGVSHTGHRKHHPQGSCHGFRKPVRIFLKGFLL